MQYIREGYAIPAYSLQICSSQHPAIWQHTHLSACPPCRMPIFLFNYSTRELHGIYRAKTDGTWKLNPAGILTTGAHCKKKHAGVSNIPPQDQLACSTAEDRRGDF